MAGKIIMSLEIYPDFEGFIYYNELLYYLYKNSMKNELNNFFNLDF